MTKRATCIRGGKIILEKGILSDKVLLFDDKIIGILDPEELHRMAPDDGIMVVDAHGDYVSPGFIDLHIHGSGGKDTMDGQLSDLQTISQTIAAKGVSSFLPATMTMEKHRIWKALEVIRLAMKGNIKGARVLGAYMEGPFISAQYKGAHPEAFLQKPDYELIRDYTDVIKIITVAPEEDPQFQFIQRVQKETGIVLSIGHTGADYETAMAAIRCGIGHATHLFNAMPPFHHRAPGAVGAVLHSGIRFELIADLQHVHPAFFQILLHPAGKDRMILVTDAMRAASMGEGSWDLGGQQVTVDHGSARLPDGTLAGSILTMNQAVRNILVHTDLQIHEAAALATLNPAKLLRMDHCKGSIEVGKDADLAVFDENFNIRMTFSEGDIIYSANQGGRPCAF